MNLKKCFDCRGNGYHFVLKEQCEKCYGKGYRLTFDDTSGRMKQITIDEYINKTNSDIRDIIE